MITNQDINALKKLFRKIKDDTDRIIQKPGSGIPFEHSIRNEVAMQNALRTCMEVMLNECVPYDEDFLIHMALRLAAYSISVAPIERQEAMAHSVAAHLPLTVLDRQRQGIGIQSEWVTNGVVHPNMPTKNNTQ